MTVITRHTQFRSGSGGLCGKLYYGSTLAWPTNSPVHFEVFSTNPYSAARPPADVFGHYIHLLDDWNGGMLAGYGSISYNLGPTYIASMNYTTGIWSTAYIAANCYGIQRVTAAPDGTLFFPALDGYSDFIAASPTSGWSQYTLPITTQTPFDHPLATAVHDGYLWVSGQFKQATGGIWRTPLTSLGGAGEVMLAIKPPGTSPNRINYFFSHAGKLWYQRNLDADGPSGSILYYWDEDEYEWIDSGMQYGWGHGSGPVLWNGEMWTSQGTQYPPTIASFDGTAFTTHVTGFNVTKMTVGDDNALYAVGTGGTGTIWRTIDGDEWVQVGMVAAAVSVRMKGGYLYVGDTVDRVWRGALGSWGED